MIQESALTLPQEPTENIAERQQIEKQPLAFRALVENATDAISINDLEGYQIYSNRACYENFGYDYEQQEMNGLPLVNLWPPENISTLTEQLLPQALVGGWSGEVRQKRKDGTTFDAHLTTFPVLDGSGKPISIAIIVHDISKRKDLERERSEIYEHRIFQIQLAAGLAQEIASAPTLDKLYRRVVTLVKERFGYYHVQVFHYIPKLNAMVRVKSYAHTDEEIKTAGHRLPYGKGIVGTAAAIGKPILVPDVSRNPHWMHHPDFPNTKGELAVPIKLCNRVLGVLDVLSDTASTLTHEDEIILLDLTSRIAGAIGNTHLLEETDILHQFAQAPEGIGWITLEDNTIVYMNPVLCHILDEAKPEDTLGKSVISYYPRELREHVQNEILPTAIREGQWSGELMLLSTQGTIIPVIQSLFLAHTEDGRPRHLATVVTDITNQKQAKLLLDKRIQQIDCLNDIGQKIKQSPRMSEFLLWLIDHIPSIMQYPDVCVVAVKFEGQVYGVAEAMALPCQIVEDIHIGEKVVGQIYASYTQKRDLLAEEKILLGDIARRVSNYIESSRLLEQTQAVLEETKASHKLYLPKQWIKRRPQQEPDEHTQPETTPPRDTGLRGSRIYTALQKAWERITTSLLRDVI